MNLLVAPTSPNSGAPPAMSGASRGGSQLDPDVDGLSPQRKSSTELIKLPLPGGVEESSSRRNSRKNSKDNGQTRKNAASINNFVDETGMEEEVLKTQLSSRSQRVAGRRQLSKHLCNEKDETDVRILSAETNPDEYRSSMNTSVKRFLHVEEQRLEDIDKRTSSKNSISLAPSKVSSSRNPSITISDPGNLGSIDEPELQKAGNAWIEEDSQEDGESPNRMDAREWGATAAIAFVAIVILVVLCVWSSNGLLPKEHMEHTIIAKTRAGHIHSPLYSTPSYFALKGTQKEVFDVRLVVMATRDTSQAGHRRLSSSSYRRLAQVAGISPIASGRFTGNLTYRLYADGQEFYRQTIFLKENEEVEHFKTVDVGEFGKNTATHYTAYVTSQTSDGRSVAFLCQVLRMGGSGRFRFALGMIIFTITFLGIVSEVIHRSYCAMLGVSALLATLAGIQETLSLKQVCEMIDYSTLCILFAMMILMGMLAITGFFNWFAFKLVERSKQNVPLLFNLLCYICGVLSMFLNNVTCVLLTGPIVYSIAAKMEVNPRPIYLALTICTTIGGTATYIGDPPNIVIGSMMKIGFETFIIVNFPITTFVLLPVAVCFLYWKTKDWIYYHRPPTASVKIDLTALEKENRITNMPMLLKLMSVFFVVLISLLLSTVHKIDPAWFAAMAMFGSAILFERHHFGKYLELVEWDTLLFFALLFVLVHTLEELGVINKLGMGLMDFIKTVPPDSRMAFAVVVILWVSSIGSAFLESLPYTTTITTIIKDLQDETIEGVNVRTLVWPLSVGACVGGIGSIMGSSANLVCMAVSSRYGLKEDEKVKGVDFLKYGLPTLVILTFITMIYQLIVFAGLKWSPE